MRMAEMMVVLAMMTACGGGPRAPTDAPGWYRPTGEAVRCDGEMPVCDEGTPACVLDDGSVEEIDRCFPTARSRSARAAVRPWAIWRQTGAW